VDDAWYSIARHTAAHRTLIEHLDLQGVTLFCQDWGGPTGLAQAAEMPERFERLVIMNTWLHHEGYDYSPAIHRWNAGWQPDGMFVTNIPERLSVGWFMMVSLGHMTAREMFAIIEDGVYPTLTPAGDAARRGYDAPFEDLGRAGHAGPRRFPLSLPFTNPEGGNAAAQQRHYDALLTWTKPVHFIWGGADNIFTEAWGREWAGRFPQATFDVLLEAGHFLQDTHGDAIADLFFARMAS
jgi:haloalkane dehalogenase